MENTQNKPHQGQLQHVIVDYSKATTSTDTMIYEVNW
jgi:hypothetical protein